MHLRIDLLPLLKTSFVAGSALAILLIAGVYLTGSSFGQRCTKAFPDSGYKQELCVERLSKGKSLAGLGP